MSDNIKNLPRRMTADEFFKETFTDDFNKEADFQYLKYQIEGRDHRIAELEAENSRLKAREAELLKHSGELWEENERLKNPVEWTKDAPEKDGYY